VVNRFNGFSQTSCVNALLLTLLASSYLGNLEPRADVVRGAAIKVSNFLTQYAESKGIHMKVNYVNPEHVHALVDMPTHYCIEEMLKLLKGASSHWINQNRLVRGKFFWDEVMESFRFRNPMSAKLSDISLPRQSIIGIEPLWKNTKTCSSDTTYGGSKQKPLKRLVTKRQRHKPLDESRG